MMGNYHVRFGKEGRPGKRGVNLSSPPPQARDELNSQGKLIKIVPSNIVELMSPVVLSYYGGW
jgi:hypothetical protein